MLLIDACPSALLRGLEDPVALPVPLDMLRQTRTHAPVDHPDCKPTRLLSSLSYLPQVLPFFCNPHVVTHTAHPSQSFSHILPASLDVVGRQVPALATLACVSAAPSRSQPSPEARFVLCLNRRPSRIVKRRAPRLVAHPFRVGPSACERTHTSRARARMAYPLIPLALCKHLPWFSISPSAASLSAPLFLTRRYIHVSIPVKSLPCG